MGEASHRRARVLRLVERGGVQSQEHLRELLRLDGIEVTQATLSRDLGALGLVKGPGGYTVPGAAPQPRNAQKEMAGALRAHLQSAQTAANLAVLRTAPGHAQALAIEIDRVGLPSVVGTLAGDDTVFIATQSPAQAGRLVQKFRTLAGLA